MQNVSSSTTPKSAALASGRLASIASALLLGTFLIYGTGFMGVPAVHNAAHDQRHALGFPCH